MKNYVTSIMASDEPGLYLCELPTGYGKTYNVVQAMKEYLETPGKHRKIIYLTTLKKNLPEDELRAAFGDEVYEKNVLRIRSNLDEVVEKIEDLYVTADFQTPQYDELLSQVKHYHKITRSDIYDKAYKMEVEERVKSAERAFRAEIAHKLKKDFPNKSKRLDAINTNPKWQWVGQLYPAVFTDERQILLMSVDKFLVRNSTLIEPSYEFLKSDLVKNAIIVIDEFDATKQTIQNKIIRDALSIKQEYLSLFRQILTGLNPEYLSRAIRDAYQRLDTEVPTHLTFDKILEEAHDIEERYSVYLSYKTADKSIDRKQNFLFKDAAFHTIFHDDKSYIRAAKNKAENRIDIFFENKKEYEQMRNSEAQNIFVYALLREINRFLIHFRSFLFMWARQYMGIVNKGRENTDDEFTLENAISSILDRIKVSPEGQRLIQSDMRSSSIHRKQKELLPDNSFYERGMEIFEFEDQDAHHDSTDLCLIAVYDTPEKILTYLAEQSSVIALSATAEVPTVIGNYDLEHLKEKLGDRFHVTPGVLKEKIATHFEPIWRPYEEGEVSIHTEVMKNKTGNFDAESICLEFFQNEDRARICARLINACIDQEYYARRYSNIVRAMHAFCSSDISSMLYLGMMLPKKNNPKLDEECLRKLFNLVIEDVCDTEDEADRDDRENTKPSLYILRSDNFDVKKSELLETLSRGERVFIMSSYQTLGAGQNLQYKAPRRDTLVTLAPSSANVSEHDQRYVYKDIDALYLDEITSLVENLNSEEPFTEENLLQALFQIEEVKQNSELSLEDADSMIKRVFRRYLGNRKERNLLYGAKSVDLQATRHVMQAVGRICRTFLKSPRIYLFIDEKLLAHLSVSELKKHILTPEMKSIVKLRENLGAEYTNEEVKLLNKAENVSSYGMWKIREVLSRNWTPESMDLWMQMRLISLRYPTADLEVYEANSLLQKLYITSGAPQNRYFYSQYSDFRDVTIDFGNSKAAFQDSGRAKMKADTGRVLVYEMSEAESGLPVLMRYPGMKEYFTSLGYATSFSPRDYMMSPVVFHNIYKGALGEVAGKFILERERGIILSEITDSDRFEFFDYEMAPGVYVDFKNWKFNYLVDRDQVRREILRKLDAIGAKRAYIINIIGDPTKYQPTAQIDARIIEIPCLIDEQGHPIRTCLDMIREEDF